MTTTIQHSSFYHLLMSDTTCTAESLGVHERIKHTEHTLKQLDTQIADIQVLLNSLVHKRKCIRDHLSSLQCTVAPIRRVPADVLIEIFKFTRDWDLTKYTIPIESRPVGPRPGRSPLRITHVCSEWRRVALSIPMFWTTIKASHRNLGPNNRLDTWLSRTGATAPLDITFEGPPDYWSSTGRPTSASLAWMRPHTHRIRNLSLSGRVSEFPGSSFDDLETLAARNLALESYSNDDVSPLGNYTAPSLRRVSFDGNFVHLKFIRWQQLTHLSIEVDRISQSVFLTVLSQSTSLESLVVRCKIDDTGYGENLEAASDVLVDDEIIIPQLTSLSIEVGSKTSWLLEQLTLPALTKLHVIGAGSWSDSAYNSFQSRSAFCLKSLALDSCDIPEPQFIDILRNTPTLTEIIADVAIHLTPTLVAALTWTNNKSSNLAPNLEHFGICDIMSPQRRTTVDNDAILRMIGSRDSSGKSAILAAEKWILSHHRVFRSHQPKRPCEDVQAKGMETAKDSPTGRESVKIFF